MIVRGPRPHQNFTVLDNAVLRNHKLSWKARGLLAYLLSLPDGWRTNATHLANVSPQGRDAVLAGLQELEAHGYLVRSRTRGRDGKVRTVTTVYDHPQAGDRLQSPGTGLPTPVNTPAYEVPNTNDVDDPLRDMLTDSIHRLAWCSTCDATGWTPAGDGTLVRCHH